MCLHKVDPYDYKGDHSTKVIMGPTWTGKVTQPNTSSPIADTTCTLTDCNPDNRVAVSSLTKDMHAPESSIISTPVSPILPHLTMQQ